MIISDLEHLEVAREQEKITGGITAGASVWGLASGNVGVFGWTKTFAATGSGQF